MYLNVEWYNANDVNMQLSNYFYIEYKFQTLQTSRMYIQRECSRGSERTKCKSAFSIDIFNRRFNGFFPSYKWVMIPMSMTNACIILAKLNALLCLVVIYSYAICVQYAFHICFLSFFLLLLC